ncbi:hypothetical protein C8J56DRAFT_895852 [Mycena floridula]|nr:hypothetical protein C8J56DRAFT_895852 [Mycena floridula]
MLLTAAERAHINQLLDTSNDEISRLSAAIDKLVLERERLQSNVASYRAILAPIRLLPEDMLREIFVSCLPSNKAASTAITDAPLLLGRICRSWREIALSTPALWASIHVRFPFKTGTNSLRAQRLCDEAHAWIARSGTCPLTIRVTMTWRNEDHISGNFVDSLSILSKRWRSIEVEAPPDWLPSLKSLSQNDVPRLERFSYSVTPGIIGDGRVSETLGQSLDILGGAELRDVTLENTCVQNPVAATSKINFEQLTRLVLNVGSQFTLLNAAAILTCCPNLIACRLSITSPHSDTTSKFTPITLLHLSSLTIELVTAYSTPDDVIFSSFFSNLTLPQLTSFSHTLGQCRIHSWIELARATPIENLALSLVDFDHPAVLEYLRTSTSLKRLKLDAWPYPDQNDQPVAGMDQLASIMDVDDPACPFLEVLEFTIFGFPEEAFVQLVRRRAALRDSQGKAHLKVVRARFHRNVELDILSQLDDLVASGLSLSVSHNPLMRLEDLIHYWPYQLPELEWP